MGSLPFKASLKARYQQNQVEGKMLSSIKSLKCEDVQEKRDMRVWLQSRK
jgi:hypothetical protein